MPIGKIELTQTEKYRLAQELYRIYITNLHPEAVSDDNQPLTLFQNLTVKETETWFDMVYTAINTIEKTNTLAIMGVNAKIHQLETLEDMILRSCKVHPGQYHATCRLCSSENPDKLDRS